VDPSEGALPSRGALVPSGGGPSLAGASLERSSPRGAGASVPVARDPGSAVDSPPSAGVAGSGDCDSGGTVWPSGASSGTYGRPPGTALRLSTALVTVPRSSGPIGW
jgi:hypothetical protein